MNLNIRHLAAIYEVGRSGSANRVVDKVFLSQPAITQAIKKCEELLGAKLFVRTPQGMLLTAEGKLFNNRIDRALRYLRQFDLVAGASRRAKKSHLMLTSSQLNSLISVVEFGSYTIAASRLGRSQPTVHRSISDLERLISQPLFSRTATGVEPNPLARRLARITRLAFREIEQGREELAEARGEIQGKIVIGCLPMARTDLLPDTVTQLAEKFPQARISIVDGPYEEQLHGLLHGDIDLILGAIRDKSRSEGIQQRALFEDPLAVVVRNNHPAAQTHPLPIDYLASLDWVAPREGTPTRVLFHELFRSAGLPEPPVLIECSSLIALRGLLLRSDRASLISRRQVRPELEAGVLTALDIELPRCLRPIGITTRSDWQPTRLQREYLTILDQLTREFSLA